MHNTHTDIAAFGAAAVVLTISWVDKIISEPSPLLQNLAYLMAITAACVGIYYKIKNKGRD